MSPTREALQSPNYLRRQSAVARIARANATTEDRVTDLAHSAELGRPLSVALLRSMIQRTDEAY